MHGDPSSSAVSSMFGFAHMLRAIITHDKVHKAIVKPDSLQSVAIYGTNITLDTRRRPGRDTPVHLR